MAVDPDSASSDVGVEGGDGEGVDEDFLVRQSSTGSRRERLWNALRSTVNDVRQNLSIDGKGKNT